MRSFVKWGLWALPLFATPALAQTPPSAPGAPGQQQPSLPGPGPGVPGQPAPSPAPSQQEPTARAGEQAAPGGTLSAADRRFVLEAARENLAEIQLGQLAMERGESADVKQFGQRMVDDHTRANEQLAVIARDVDISLPVSPSDRQQATYNRLSKLSGKQFDRAYINHMNQAHRRAVTLFQRQSQQGTHPRLREFANQTLPTLRTHHDLATREQRQM